MNCYSPIDRESSPEIGGLAILLRCPWKELESGTSSELSALSVLTARASDPSDEAS